MARTDRPAFERRWQELGGGGQRLHLRGHGRHAPVVRRDAAPVGVCEGLALRAVTHRRRHRSGRGRGRRAVSIDRRCEELERAVDVAHSQHRFVMATRRGRHVLAHHHPESGRSRPDLRGHLVGGGVSHRRRRRHVASDQPRSALRGHPRRGRRGWSLRTPTGDPPDPARHCVHAEALGRHAQRQRGGLMDTR